MTSRPDATDLPALSDLLRATELLAGLLDDDIAYAVERSALVAVSSGERIFSPGEPAERFYVVLHGEVAAFSAGEGEREIARFVQGDALGDFDFAVAAPYGAEARAVSDAELIVFPRPGLDMQDLAREKPDAAARILLRCVSMVSARLRATQRLISDNAPWVRELRRQVYTDAGTGLHSRAFFDEELPRLLEAPAALVLVKPDRFKDLVDAAGHSAGDEAMSRFAALLVHECERLGRGWAVRLRSNEMALVVPRSSPDEAVELARRLALAVAGLRAPAPLAQGFVFSASIAVTVWPDAEPDWRRCVERAYGVLMRAWRSGGARIYRVRPSISPSAADMAAPSDSGEGMLL